jgi:hypothetical protein
MDEFRDLISKISGNYDPVRYQAIICTTQWGTSHIIKVEDMENDLYNNIFDGNVLDDIVDEKYIPGKVGVYTCDIVIQSFRSNRFDDPEEWDMNIWLENIVKPDIVYGVV